METYNQIAFSTSPGGSSSSSSAGGLQPHMNNNNNNTNINNNNLIVQQQQQQHHHHQHNSSLSNFSSDNQSQLSDTISETSDNATILSLSREDLTALGAGSIREDVRVSRKKLECLILQEREHALEEKGFMEKVMENSNTFIQWPSRMKIGAKTKKDLFVRIYAHNQEDINEAKYQVLQELGPQRDLRITLKLEVSYTDHSHLIGCRGATIRKVMEDTGCHIHFPDSNRMSKDHKSNQVTIAGGSIHAVEQARSRVRELSPLIFQFNLPIIQNACDMNMDSDSHHIFIDNIQTNYNVQVAVHPPNKLQQTTISVKGCEVDSGKIKEAIGKIISYFSPGTHVNLITMESAIEISAVQHCFVRAVNDSNIHNIMMNTGAKIIFPDLSDNNIQQIKRSRIYISGDINSVYFARQQLIGCLPLRMIFDVNDEFPLDWENVRAIGTDLNVAAKLINRNRIASGGAGGALPPPIPGRSRTLQLISAERNSGNIYEARRQILGGLEPPFIANVPASYALRPVHPPVVHQYGNHLGVSPLKQLMPSSPNISPVLSPSFWPPTPFAPPFRSPPAQYTVGKEKLNLESLPAPPGFRPKPLNSTVLQQQNIRYSVPPGNGGRSNLFDLAPTLKLDHPSNDLQSLFLQNGLEKYIDAFRREEIDFDSFSSLTEDDLRSLGVTSYPARKRMLLLIKQLFMQQQQHHTGHHWN